MVRIFLFIGLLATAFIFSYLPKEFAAMSPGIIAGSIAVPMWRTAGTGFLWKPLLVATFVVVVFIGAINSFWWAFPAGFCSSFTVTWFGYDRKESGEADD